MWGWYTTAQLQNVWPQAPADTDLLDLINTAAISQLEAYAPPGLPVTNPDFLQEDGYTTEEKIKPEWRLAQVQQCKNLWNAGRTDPNGSVGDGSFQLSPFPLDKQVRAILRPPRAVPRF